MDEHTSLEQEPPLLEVPQSANLKEIEVAGSAVGSMPPSHGRALFALLLMSALSPARAASGDEKPLGPGWLWWLVMVFVAAASCLLGHWLTRRRNTPIEAVKLRDEALDSMILYRQRAIENQKAAREQRIANELVLQELDQARSELQELQQRHHQRGPPLTPQEEADRRIAAESHYRETLLDAKGLLQRCWREMVEHARTCPMRDEVFMASRGRVWHHNPDCPVLQRQALNVPPSELLHYMCFSSGTTGCSPCSKPTNPE